MKATSEENSKLNTDRTDNHVVVSDSSDKGETAVRVLTAIFYILLLLFPFCIGVLNGTINLFSDWTWLFEGHDKAFYFQQDYNGVLKAFLFCLIVFASIGLVSRLIAVVEKKIRQNHHKLYKASIVIFLFLGAVGIRSALLVLFWGEVFPASPYSDFAKSWARAIGDLSSLDYYHYFPGYINFSTIERWIAGFSNSLYEAVICFSVFCNSLTAVFIFLLSDEIFDNRSISFFASALYILNPSSIFYTITSTPEHLAIACFTGSIYVICLAAKADKIIFRFALLIIAGLLGGLGDSVKAFFPVITIAYIIVLILSLFRKDQKKTWKRICIAILSVIILYGTKSAVVEGITCLSEKEFQVELNFADATPHYLNVGLNRQGEGQIHVGNLSRLYIQDRTDGFSLEEAKERAVERVSDDWDQHKDELPSFIVKKMIWSWQDDFLPLEYFLNRTGWDCNTRIEVKAIDTIRLCGPTITQVWYLISMLLGLIGTAFILKQSKQEERNLKFVFSNLMIIGYFFLILLLEAQSRYKCLILPFVCVLNAYAVFSISNTIRPPKRFNSSSKTH